MLKICITIKLYFPNVSVYDSENGAKKKINKVDWFQRVSDKNYYWSTMD